MVVFAYPDTLFNMCVEAMGDYVSALMRRLISDRRYTRGPDGKFHHYEEPCNRLQVHISSCVPPNIASEVSLRLIRKLSVCYTDLISDESLKIACEEIAPYVVKAVIRHPVKCLDFTRDIFHPTLLDYYKAVHVDLIYRTLPLLKDIKVLRLGGNFIFANAPVVVDGFSETLEEFACGRLRMEDLVTLADKCKHIRRLDVDLPHDYTPRDSDHIFKFEYLEELNLFTMWSDDLYHILLRLIGAASDEASSEQSEHTVAPTAGSSQDSGNTSAAEGSRTSAARIPGLIKTFQCRIATAEEINLISKFHNLNSLVLACPSFAGTLEPLGNLKLLKNLALISDNLFHVKGSLRSIGKQLTCLTLDDVRNTDFLFITENCRSLECLHLSCGFRDCLMLPSEYRNPVPSQPLPDFSHVVSLELSLTHTILTGYVLSCFRNVKKLSLVSTGEDLLLLERLIQRRIMTRLEELYWGHDTVIHLNGSTATKTVFYYSGEVLVDHILT
jgi:hypothetical protein